MFSLKEVNPQLICGAGWPFTDQPIFHFSRKNFSRLFSTRKFQAICGVLPAE
jgi:hypothetical protein